MRWRGRELWLLMVALMAIFVTAALLRAATGGDPARPGTGELAIAGAFLATHVWLSLRLPRADQIMLPIVALLTGLGWVMVTRLDPELTRNQLLWIGLGAAILVATVTLAGDLGWLQRYRYTWALVGLVLMLLTALFGPETYGARLWLSVGGISFQPTELMKVLLVVFMAAYLADKREVLSRGAYRWGRLKLPPLPHLLPLMLMWGLSLLMLLWQHDLGAMLLLLLIALAMLFVATGRWSYLIGGGLICLLNLGLGYLLFGYVRSRIETWLNPWADPQGHGYQVVQGLVALASGGIFGTGIGLGHPDVIPASFTDFIFAAVGEELGLAGAAAVLVTYLALVGRGCYVALHQRNEFRQLVAFGLSAMLGLQTLIIVGGNLGLLPLTGITLPFMSYGGSSLTANFFVLGLLLRVSALAGVAAVPRPRAVARAGGFRPFTGLRSAPAAPRGDEGTVSRPGG